MHVAMWTGLNAAENAPRRRDFPYYAGRPVALCAGGWSLLLLSVLAGFGLLLWAPFAGAWGQWLTRLLFVGLPLACLAWLAGREAWALFGPFGGREAAFSAGAALLAIVASFAAALVVGKFSTVAPNPEVQASAGLALPAFALQLLSMAPQLLGEELLTILPFLALLHLASMRLGWSRGRSIALAFVGSTLLFSAAHLPTYDWNWAQCFGVIGAARAVLTLAYIATRNLWVSTGAHILTDWTEFTLAFLVIPSTAA